jgi:hypothetical protein
MPENTWQRILGPARFPLFLFSHLSVETFRRWSLPQHETMHSM